MKEVINHMAAKLSKVAVITGIVAGTIVGPMAIANAASSQYCTFGKKLHREITVSGNTASATFDIPKHCAHNLKYSLVVYTICDPSMRPFSAQKYHAHKTMKFDAGRKTISGVPVPSKTYYQIDLIKGDPIMQLRDEGTYAPAGRLINAYAGGEPCEQPAQPAPAPTPTPAQPAAVHVENNNVNVNAQTQTQTVNVPAAPAPVAPVAPAVEVAGKGPEVLPNTGAGSVAAAFMGVSSVSALAYNLVLRRFKG